MRNSWRIDDGEEARLTPEGPTAAAIVSRGVLPLRVRDEGAAYRRAPFPGSAVLLGEDCFEVVGEEIGDGGATYRLEPWPADHVRRAPVAYGPELVQAAQDERRRADVRKRARPFQPLLYPLLGWLPEDRQVRACDRFGLDPVMATFASGGMEMLLAYALFTVLRRDPTGVPGAFALVTGAAAYAYVFILPAVARMVFALVFREVAGSWLVNLGFRVAEALRLTVARFDETVVPVTREAFWARLALADRHEKDEDGSILVRALLPHLSWERDKRVRAGADHWMVVRLPPVMDKRRLTYRYQLTPLAEGVSEPPRPTAYAEEVREGVAREWGDLLGPFSWLVSMLPSAVQARAVGRQGGPAALRTPAIVTALVTVAIALRLGVAGLQPGAIGFVDAMLRFGVLADGLVRLGLVAQGRYAPSLFGLLISDYLRPERLPYHAHRDAERAALSGIGATRAA
jgi:hypothetical protein